jgi:large subunit ribosomal protein L10
LRTCAGAIKIEKTNYFVFLAWCICASGFFISKEVLVKTSPIKEEGVSMASAEKSAVIAEMTENFRKSTATVMTEYRGLTVTQLKELRRALGPTTTYSVVKNTLSRLAAKAAGVEGLDEMLKGPSAIAFIEGDAVESAKGLKNFAKDNPALVIKGAYMDGKVLSPKEILRLADLESREVLLAKLAGAMNASLSQAVYLLAAPLAKTARALGALQSQKSQEN